MIGNMLVENLLRFKDLRLVDFGFEGRENFVITVKLYRNGCQRP